MNIITCAKMVPDDEAISFGSNGELDIENAGYTISNYDMNAIEAATQIVEAVGGTQVVLSVGPNRITDSKLKKKILSRGPDSFFAVTDDDMSVMDAYRTSCALKCGVERIGEFDLIVCGEGSADSYAKQVGIQLGQLLGIPAVNCISKIVPEEGRLICERTLENEVDVIEVPLPAVIAVTSDINVTRLPNMKAIMAAGKKPMTSVPAGEFEGVNASMEEISLLQPKQTGRKMDIVKGDSDESIALFISKIAEELK